MLTSFEIYIFEIHNTDSIPLFSNKFHKHIFSNKTTHTSDINRFWSNKLVFQGVNYICQFCFVVTEWMTNFKTHVFPNQLFQSHNQNSTMNIQHITIMEAVFQTSDSGRKLLIVVCSIGIRWREGHWCPRLNLTLRKHNCPSFFFMCLYIVYRTT